MPIIDRYIARHFFIGSAIVLLVLLPLFGFLTLSEELENVGKGAYTSFDAFVVVLYSLPRLALDLLPVTAILAVLIGLGAMANCRELIIINAFGYSARRTAWPVVQACLLMIGIIWLIQFLVIPKFELNAARVRQKATPQTTIAATRDDELWTRSGEQFIRVGDVVQYGGLRDVEIFKLDTNGNLKELVQASSADVLGGGLWMLNDVRITNLDAYEVKEERLETKLWQSFLSEKQTTALVVPVEAMAPIALYRHIRLLDKNRLDTHRFRIILWQQLGIPIGLLAMALLGLPFLLGSVRSVSAGQRAAIGGSIGILFFLAEQMTSQLAQLYNLPAAPAALAPDLSLLVLAIIILHRID